MRATSGIATVLFASSMIFGIVGCDQPAPIRQYTISTDVPDSLRSQDRMLAAIIPQEFEVWFFKVVGPAEAVGSAATELHAFMKQVEFIDGKPELRSLPEGWKQTVDEKPMRFATVMIPTPTKELELSISSLPKTGDWDDQVAMNVNRWRGQMKMADSLDRWAGAQPLKEDDPSGESAAWVDLTGEMGSGPPAMSGMASAPFASGELPAGHPDISASGSAGVSGSAAAADSPGEANGPPMPASNSVTGDRASGDTESAENPAGLQYDAPADWRKGKMSMMRMAAFEIGPEDRSAELTIIQAGGDLRGNVDRWLGQVRGDSPPSEVVDAALQDAQPLQVSGLDAQRFFLNSGKENAPEAQAIDATIVPLEGGMSLFIKATGPEATLQEQRPAIGQFLESLSLPQ